jgi:sugar phosphate isomerase/epimerase
MKESMKERTRLSIFSWFGFVLPLPERLRLIREAGFDAVTVWWEDEIGYPVIEKERFPQMVRDAGLVLENMHVPCNNSNDLWSRHEPARKRIVEQHVAWLEDCAKHGIPLMVMHLTEGKDPPGPNGYGIESLLRLARFAEEAGVKIAVENTRRGDNVPFVLAEIESDFLGCCFDSSHANLHHRDRGEGLLTQFGHRVLATHLSDNDGVEDRHWLPGHGVIDWGWLGALLASSACGGRLTLEVWPRPEEMQQGPEAFLNRAFRTLPWASSPP